MVLLTKSDLGDDPAAVIADVEAGVGGTPVLPVSAIDGSGLDELRALLRPGRTAVMPGTSGVGKSTLLNVLPGGALLIDTPGLRRTRVPSEHLQGDAGPQA